MKHLKRYFLKFIYPVANVYWFLFRPRSLGVRVMVFNEKDKVLLIKHTYRSKYFFPGGSVKKGEQLETAAIREVHEETGLELSKVKFHGIYRKFDEFKDDTLVIYSSMVNNQTPKADEIEIESADWYSKDNLPEDLDRGMRERIRERFPD